MQRSPMFLISDSSLSIWNAGTKVARQAFGFLLSKKSFMKISYISYTNP